MINIKVCQTVHYGFCFSTSVEAQTYDIYSKAGEDQSCTKNVKTFSEVFYEG